MKRSSELKKIEPECGVEFVITQGVIVEGDARLLHIALENLLTNTWKFTGKYQRARIEFGVKQHNRKSVCYARDDGVGFDMAYATRLFGAFQRLHEAAPRRG